MTHFFLLEFGDFIVKNLQEVLNFIESSLTLRKRSKIDLLRINLSVSKMRISVVKVALMMLFCWN